MADTTLTDDTAAPETPNTPAYMIKLHDAPARAIWDRAKQRARDEGHTLRWIILRLLAQYGDGTLQPLAPRHRPKA